MIPLKILIVWYLIFSYSTFLIEDTTAIFNDVYITKGKLSAGEWESTNNWDNTSLKFLGIENSSSKRNLGENFGFSCEKGLYSDIFNNSENSMEGQSEFHVYFHNLKEPNSNLNDKQEVYKGDIPMLLSNEVERLTFKDINKIKLGYYKFLALRRPGHPYPEKKNQEGNKNMFEDRLITWGGTIKVTKEDLDKCFKQSTEIEANKKEESPEIPEKSLNESSVSNPSISEEKKTQEVELKERKPVESVTSPTSINQGDTESESNITQDLEEKSDTTIKEKVIEDTNKSEEEINTNEIQNSEKVD
ncbi:hypothetical protein [Rossellomorea aquimaris]|uniref:Uncharacterized protein n=1 Tax=Rossellomorea aquimaris TaxID=189382 RepID=A0A5D4TVE6_9BACI|nr:hypothetical protein [Rossellomorea aquimaris]TYS78442.1 hypothetical protein FZC80_11840 [Rossellomorea aquimaris]